MAYRIEMSGDGAPCYWSKKPGPGQPQGHFGDKEAALIFLTPEAAQAYVYSALPNMQDAVRIVQS